jgi:hypothetical protein
MNVRIEITRDTSTQENPRQRSIPEKSNYNRSHHRLRRSRPTTELRSMRGLQTRVAIRVTVRHHIKATQWINSKTKQLENRRHTCNPKQHTTIHPRPNERIQPKPRDREVKDENSNFPNQQPRDETRRYEDERRETKNNRSIPSPKATEPSTSRFK